MYVYIRIYVNIYHFTRKYIYIGLVVYIHIHTVNPNLYHTSVYFVLPPTRN